MVFGSQVHPGAPISLIAALTRRIVIQNDKATKLRGIFFTRKKVD